MTGHSLDIDLVEKENRVFDLRVKHGWTFERIAQETGYANKSSVRKAFLRALERIGTGDRKEIIQTEVERLDVLTETYWESAKEGNSKAADMILRLMDKKLEFIKFGMPIKIEAEVVNYNGVRTLDDEVEQLARVIEYIEGTATNITDLVEQSDQSEPIDVESPSAQGATGTAG